MEGNYFILSDCQFIRALSAAGCHEEALSLINKMEI
jgi:pentatricopeptide repeat protein